MPTIRIGTFNVENLFARYCLLLSKSLADANGKKPYIERQGMPKRADRYKGPRFPGVGLDRPKASDHCPVVVELTV